MLLGPAPAHAAEGSTEAPALPAVTVTGGSSADQGNGAVHGYVAEQATAGSKTDTPILEIPQSISVVTREQMEVLQPLSSSEALRYTGGAVSEKYGGFGGQLDLTRIRGFDADYYLDGLRIISNVSTWTPQIDPYSLERIEVLRGPSAALYGQGTGGGIVNQVSRRPQAEASNEVIMQLGNFGRRMVGVDTTGPANADGSLLYRFTATGLDSGGQVEDVKHKRIYLAPALTWRPNTVTSWTLLATHSREPEIPDYNSLPAAAVGLDNSPFPKINLRRNYTDMGFQDSSRKQNSVSSLFEHQFGNGWKFTSNSRYMYINSDIQRTSIYGYENRGGHLWLQGTYGLAPASSNTFSTDNHVTKSVDLGSTRHTLLMGLDYARGSMRSDSYRMDPVAFDPYDPTNYRPVAVPDFSHSMSATPYNVRQQFERVGIYAQDQMAYERWRLTLNARHDWSKTDDQSRSYSPKWNNSQQKDSKWSGRLGLNYLFDNGVAPYLSYATSFDPVLGNDVHGRARAPTETTQYEAGVKYHPAGSKTLLSAAVFQINQTNVKTADTRNLGFWTQSGEVRSRGLDLQASAEIVRNLNLLASYSYLDNVLVSDANYQGKSQAQTPRHSGALWLDYRVASGWLSGLRVGAGARYLGSSFGNPMNTFTVPSVTLVDLAFSYDLGHLSRDLHGASLAINVSNLANKQYIASCGSQLSCFIGQDRTITATARFRW
ncbi:MAG: TonB-dependent siderophore receptor [Acidovorax sp.]|jgi:iron complex outermembrane receptor protein|nr:TonB-dependent siderophore receptor [Acidovorax sp.]